MGDLWLSFLAFFGDREARKTINRRRGARKAAVTRRYKRGMDSSTVLGSSMAVREGAPPKDSGIPVVYEEQADGTTKVWQPDPRD